MMSRDDGECSTWPQRISHLTNTNVRIYPVKRGGRENKVKGFVW